MTSELLNLNSIEEAYERIKPYIHKTPVLTCSGIDKIVGDGKQIFFKCENFQKSGSFKARGALNSIFMAQKRDDIKNGRGVITKSFGNHGESVAWAAQQLGIPSIIVIPEATPKFILDKIKSYGAKLELSEWNTADWAGRCDKVQKETGYYMVDPHNDYDIMAGAVESYIQVPNLDAIIISIGGGGLGAAVAKYAKLTHPHVKVFCAEPEGKKIKESLVAGKRLWNGDKFIDTIADALKVPRLGDKCFDVIYENCEHTVFSLTTPEIVYAMKLIYERLKLVVEPSAALGLAAVLKYREELKDYKHIGLVLCGGNLDLKNLPF
uniref:L-serine ammonia-lyase n=1 Tax=Acrobeloides nanus TaxID=290746 RepID=A0A914CB82_9BILA